LNPADFAGGLDLYRSNIALEFITGYVVEYALSVDNIFVIVLIFTAFKVSPKHYHKVLFWGIIGAVLMRFVFIFVGAALITRFEWILYIFGAFLVYTGVMMFVKRNQEENIDPENHPVVKLASKYFAVHPKFEGDKFFVKQGKKSLVTPLFLVLLIIEFTDLIFAVDSIPAVFSVTKDASGAEHGLIASMSNVSENAGWSENTRLETKANSKTDGPGNTTTILNSGASKKSAAGVCDKYAEGEFADWYLPAADQMKTLHSVFAELNKVLETNSKAQKLEDGWYWTSTEDARGSALGCDFSNGEISMSNKLRTGYVRAVRAF